MSLSKSTIPKDLLATALLYFKYKAIKSDKFDGNNRFRFTELGNSDYRWALLQRVYAPVWKWLLFLRLNNLKCEKQNIQKFNEYMTESEGREIGTIQQWQSVINAFIDDCGNGFQSEVVKAINKKVESGCTVAKESEGNRTPPPLKSESAPNLNGEGGVGSEEDQLIDMMLNKYRETGPGANNGNGTNDKPGLIGETARDGANGSSGDFDVPGSPVLCDQSASQQFTEVNPRLAEKVRGIVGERESGSGSETTSLVEVNSQRNTSPLPPLQRGELEAVKSFLSSLNNANTLRAYTTHIGEFFQLHQIHPGQVTVDMINLYVRSLKEQGNGISTIKVKLSAMSKLYSFLTRPQGASHSPVVQFNPFENIVMPKIAPYASAKKIDLDTAKVILNSIDCTEAIGARDRAFYLWLLLTGRRMNEIRILRRSDLRAGERSKVMYSFQPEKDRYDYSVQEEILPLPVWKAIVNYWKLSDRELNSDSPIFLSESNNGKNGNEPLSDTAFRTHLKIYCCMAGTDGSEVDLHSFRHCYAQTLAEMGVDLKRIQEKLGHQSIATTQVYLQSISSSEDKFWEGIMEKLGQL